MRGRYRRTPEARRRKAPPSANAGVTIRCVLAARVPDRFDDLALHTQRAVDDSSCGGTPVVGHGTGQATVCLRPRGRRAGQKQGERDGDPPPSRATTGEPGARCAAGGRRSGRHRDHSGREAHEAGLQSTVYCPQNEPGVAGPPYRRVSTCLSVRLDLAVAPATADAGPGRSVSGSCGPGTKKRLWGADRGWILPGWPISRPCNPRLHVRPRRRHDAGGVSHAGLRNGIAAVPHQQPAVPVERVRRASAWPTRASAWTTWPTPSR